MRGCGWQVEDENGNGVEMGLIVIHVWVGGFRVREWLGSGQGKGSATSSRRQAPCTAATQICFRQAAEAHCQVQVCIIRLSLSMGGSRPGHSRVTLPSRRGTS